MGNNPTLQQLRAFQAVATHLHFGKAAARLHTTQPPLTRHIQALETAVGVRLFQRDSRNVRLTPAGRAFLLEIDVVVARLERAMELAKATADGQTGQMVLGYVEPMATRLLPEVLSQFALLHPSLELDLHLLDTRDQIAGLHEGRIDCGLIRAPANVDPTLDFEDVCTDVFVAAIPRNHPIAGRGRREIDLAELAGESFITYQGKIGQGMIHALLNGCASAGFSPTVDHQVQSTLMLLALVASGQGVSVVSREIASSPSAGVAFVRLVGDPVTSSILMAHRRGEDSAARDNLVHLLRRAAGTPAAAPGA